MRDISIGWPMGVIVGGILFFSSCNCFSSKEQDIAQDTTIVAPQPLNHLYTNDDSEFDETDKFDNRIVRFMRQWNIVGASVAVMRNDSLLYCKGYGYSNRETEERTEVRHLFRIASVSKLITATAIMKLAEDGKLTLDTPVFGDRGILRDSITVEEKDRKLKLITIEHLLRHQGGFSQRWGDPLFDYTIVGNKLKTDIPLKEQDLVNYAALSRLRYRPGTYASYSNLGYVLLGKIIEVVSGMKYEEYVKEYILKPAGCYNMYIGNNRQENYHPDEVHYYEPEDHDLVPDLLQPRKMVRKSNGGNDVHLLGAAGGWIASPVELMRFISCIDGENNGRQLLSRASINRMTDPQEHGFPIGWMKTFISGDWRRSGSMAGTSALIRHQPNGYTWVMITNTSSWKGSEFTALINQMMTQNIKNVKKWPLRDMFEKAEQPSQSPQDTVKEDNSPI